MLELISDTAARGGEVPGERGAFWGPLESSHRGTVMCERGPLVQTLRVSRCGHF